jgi:large subunit ribosomal protein L18
MVIRGSLKNISIQLIKAEIAGDKIIVSVHSNELAKKYGWQGGGGNLPVAYLTGLLCGYKAIANGVKEAVLDLGLQAPTKGSRVFAVLKGALDAGVMIPHDESKLPDEKRIQGVHVTEYAKKLSSSQDIYQRQFSEQLSRGLRPEELTGHFSQVRQKISSSFPKVEALKEKEEKEKSSEVISKSKKMPPRKAAGAKKTAKPRVKKREQKEKSEKKK